MQPGLAALSSVCLFVRLAFRFPERLFSRFSSFWFLSAVTYRPVGVRWGRALGRGRAARPDQLERAR